MKKKTTSRKRTPMRTVKFLWFDSQTKTEGRTVAFNIRLRLAKLSPRPTGILLTSVVKAFTDGP